MTCISTQIRNLDSGTRFPGPAFRDPDSATRMRDSKAKLCKDMLKINVDVNTKPERLSEIDENSQVQMFAKVFFAPLIFVLFLNYFRMVSVCYFFRYYIHIISRLCSNYVPITSPVFPKYFQIISLSL